MRIEHVALYVNDLENTKKFFMKYLGAKSNAGYHNQKTGFYSYFLTFEDGARIEIMNLPEMADLPKKIVRTGYSHIAFSVGSIEIVDEKSQPIILQLIREGKPEGECSMLSLLSIDESLNDKVLILCI